MTAQRNVWRIIDSDGGSVIYMPRYVNVEPEPPAEPCANDFHKEICPDCGEMR